MWLYNAVGLVYLDAGDAERALMWLSDGLELAVRTGDPEDLAVQLFDLRDEALDRLGREPDDLHERAEIFIEDRWEEEPFPDDDLWYDDLWDDGSDPFGPGASSFAQLALVWFPPGEFDESVRRWPQLAEHWEADSYEAYVRTLQGHLLAFAAETGRNPSIAPVEIDPYLAWCRNEGHDPGERSSRAAYAAIVAGRGEAVAWPPGRNDPCWCRSGRKYKRCCGTVTRPDP